MSDTERARMEQVIREGVHEMSKSALLAAADFVEKMASIGTTPAEIATRLRAVAEVI